MPDSRTILELLETNEPPTELETSLIRKLLLEEHARRAQLNATIAVTEESVEELIAEWESLDEQLSKYEAVLSPLRSIPTELLSLIFTFALLVPCDTLEEDPPLWTLGQVCRRWRDTLVSQPTFWAKVDLDLAVRGDETAFRLKTHLQRSGDLLLDI